MCGIAGIIDWKRHPKPQELWPAVERMRMRGPDNQAVVNDGPVAFGHTRLAVIDLKPDSNQPLEDADHTALIVFNGEIYNYKELRAELLQLGGRFKTDSDTEVILEAYKIWGTDCLRRFNGMFAFALWDRRKQTILLARDRLGKKPLFYATLPDGRFVFASDLWALRRIPEVPTRYSADAVNQYLALSYILTDTCILEGVAKLKPAHFILVSPNGVSSPVAYWDLASFFMNKTSYGSEEEAAERLRELVEDSVRLRMISDVPLGAFLSGGVDSSIVIGAMAGGGQVPSTFTIDFAVKSFSEAAQARVNAAFIGANHHEKLVDAHAAVDLSRIVSSVSEPFADTSIVPTYYLSDFARKNVTVCLSGDGCDEIMAGYETYRADRLRHWSSWLPASLTRSLLWASEKFMAPSFAKVGFDYKLQKFLRGHALAQDEAHYSWREIFSATERSRLLRNEHLRNSVPHSPYACFEQHSNAVRGCHYLDRAMYVDIKTWLVDDILVKVDQASMAHSLEVRAPFLDHRLVEFAAGLSPNWKMKGMEQKYLLKKGCGTLLPKSTKAGKKRGFNAPVADWLAGPLEELARHATLGPHMREWVDTDEVNRLWSEHVARRFDHGFKLFTLTCLGLWMEQS